MVSKTVYLVSGANRGIGLGLVTVLASRPDTIVFAGVRDPSKVPELDAVVSKHPESLNVVELSSGGEADNKAAIAEIEKVAGQLDVIIANAGISKYYGPLVSTPISEIRDHWEVNAVGPLVLFQAAAPLLLKSATPKFAVISTAAASINDYTPISAGAYAGSKCSVNFFVRTLHYEHDNLISTAISPGWVQTSMGNAGAQANGMAAAPVTVDDSVNGILGLVDKQTREAYGGKFLNAIVKSDMPWDKPTEELVF